MAGFDRTELFSYMNDLHFVILHASTVSDSLYYPLVNNHEGGACKEYVHGMRCINDLYCAYLKEALCATESIFEEYFKLKKEFEETPKAECPQCQKI